MNKVTRASTGETSWAARYWGENSSIVVDLRKLDSKLKNKTRSQVFTDGCEEHDAFRVILLWLWRKWVMHNATGKHVAISDIPPHVQKCLDPFANGELKPCPSCKAGVCTFMSDALVWLAALSD